MWRIDNEFGVLCETCETATREQNAEKAYARALDLGLCEEAAILIRSIARPYKRGDITHRIALQNALGALVSTGPGRFVVRCSPLRPGPCWTVGKFEAKDAAGFLASIWGQFVYTEVRVVTLKKGDDSEASTLDDWERMYGGMRVPLMPPRPPSFIGPPLPRYPRGGRRW